MSAAAELNTNSDHRIQFNETSILTMKLDAWKASLGKRQKLSSILTT